MQPLLEELPALRGKLLEAVDRDSRAFDRYMEALAMPKATPEEQTARKAAMQEGLKAAAQVPMEVAETVASLFPALETAVRKGNPNAVTDGMVGTMLARTAVLGALFNVRVNLDSIHDPDFTAAMAAGRMQPRSLPCLGRGGFCLPLLWLVRCKTLKALSQNRTVKTVSYRGLCMTSGLHGRL